VYYEKLVENPKEGILVQFVPFFWNTSSSLWNQVLLPTNKTISNKWFLYLNFFDHCSKLGWFKLIFFIKSFILDWTKKSLKQLLPQSNQPNTQQNQT
jgi:hypothetical protein